MTQYPLAGTEFVLELNAVKAVVSVTVGPDKQATVTFGSEEQAKKFSVEVKDDNTLVITGLDRGQDSIHISNLSIGGSYVNFNNVTIIGNRVYGASQAELPTINVQIPQGTQIEAAKVSQLIVEGHEGDIQVAQGSSATVRNTANLKLTLSGGSSAQVSQVSQRLTLQCLGGSSVSAEGDWTDAVIKISGGASASIYGTIEALIFSVTGGASANIRAKVKTLVSRKVDISSSVNGI